MPTAIYRGQRYLLHFEREKRVRLISLRTGFEFWAKRREVEIEASSSVTGVDHDLPPRPYARLTQPVE